MKKPGVRLRACWPALLLLLQCPNVAAESEEDFDAFRDAEAIYQAALETEDCGEIDSARLVLQGLSRSEEPVPPSVADELQTGRAQLGDYARRARRALNKHWGELCRTPTPDCVPPPPVQQEELEAIYALAGLTPDCGVAREIAERLIAASDPASAAYTLTLLSRLRRERPECFP